MQVKNYPKNWKEIAFKAKERAGWRCRICRAYNNRREGHALEVHHVDGDRENNKPRNLLAVCQQCHLKLERGRRQRIKEEREILMGQGFLFGGG